jgi:hypothetical protein
VEAESIGLKIISLETERPDLDFQDCVLSIHHAFMHTFSNTTCIKIIENHNEKAYIWNVSPDM